MSKPKPTGPKITGWCAAITNPNGDVVASYVDCERHGYGGMSLSDAQQYRARTIARKRFAGNHLNGWMAAKADDYFCDQFWRLAESAGYKLQLIQVGNDSEEGQ